MIGYWHTEHAIEYLWQSDIGTHWLAGTQAMEQKNLYIDHETIVTEGDEINMHLKQQLLLEKKEMDMNLHTCDNYLLFLSLVGSILFHLFSPSHTALLICCSLLHLADELFNMPINMSVNGQ